MTLESIDGFKDGFLLLKPSDRTYYGFLEEMDNLSRIVIVLCLCMEI